jgi:carbon-monoxide dehydrogenase large subunit
MKFGLGQPIRRLEDHRLLTGRGRFTDDIDFPDQAYAAVVRSPHAHARITGLDTRAALACPGVLAVFTGEDIAADGLGPLPCLIPLLSPLKRPSGEPMYVPPRPLLIRDAVRTVGDYVALVVAETVDQAKDAAEQVDVAYEPLAAVADGATARDEGAPVVWNECPDNVCFALEAGDRAAVDRAFAEAAHVVRLDYPVSRVAINPMEPRAAVGLYDAAEDRYTLYSGTQGPHDLRRFIAQSVLKVPETRLRIVSPDMGGAFGLRSSPFPELPLVLWAARKLGRPVKWTADRTESFLCDDHGRDSLWSVALALDEAGEFLALRVEQTANMGAYLSLFGPAPAFLNLGGLAGVYRTPAISVSVAAVFTHTTPIAPYRGAGRREASYASGQAIDLAARELGIDRVALRRRNLIAPEAFPFQTGLTFVYDSGAFEANMDKAVVMADHVGFEARREAAQARGRLRGFGIANAIEQSAGGFEEYAQLRFDPGGAATLAVGTNSHGQGHETVFKQLLADVLGMAPERIRFVQGDTDQVPYGHGTFGSRSSGAGGAAILGAAEKVIEKCRAIAAHHFETAAADVEFENGEFRVAGTDRRVAFEEVVRMAFMRPKLPPGMEPGMQADGTFVPPAPTFPNGCHACEVEIDPETGALEIVRYCVVDDVGTEEVVWDRETGQLQSGSFMDYCMPRADTMPPFELATNPVPTSTNPLGIKGAGEAGCVGAMPCVMSAIADALAPLGVAAPEMPVTPEKLWRALRDAGPTPAI